MPEFLKYFVRFRFLYVLLGGLFFYLVSITFDLVFVPMLEMPENFCEKWIERKITYRSQKQCVQFTDEVQKLKYRHNQKMEKRRASKILSLFLIASMLTFSIMLLSPHTFIDQKITFENYTGAMTTAIFYGVIIGFLLPTVFQALLPAPAEWLPSEFFEIQKARTELILREIIEHSG
jgi:hypothetical protein